MFKDAFAYPFRKDGWIMLLMGAVGMGLSGVFCSTFLSTFIAGYFATFYLEIVGSTMTGHDSLPDWPGLQGNWWDDVFTPLLCFQFPMILAFGPAAALWHFEIPGGEWHLAALAGAVVFGCLYFPMATMAFKAFGAITATLPHRVLPGMFRASPGYLSAAALLCGIIAIFSLGAHLCEGVPWAGWLLAGTLGFYAMTVQGRLIGLIYLQKREALGWE